MFTSSDVADSRLEHEVHLCIMHQSYSSKADRIKPLCPPAPTSLRARIAATQSFLSAVVTDLIRETQGNHGSSEVYSCSAIRDGCRHIGVKSVW